MEDLTLLTLKLLYFDVSGKAECLRLAMHYGAIPLEDYRFSSKEEFQALKENACGVDHVLSSFAFPR